VSSSTNRDEILVKTLRPSSQKYKDEHVDKYMDCEYKVNPWTLILFNFSYILMNDNVRLYILDLEIIRYLFIDILLSFLI